MFDYLKDQINQTVQTFIDEAHAQWVPTDRLGLDRRASWNDLAVTRDWIAVPLDQDRTMQYYGGFEYIDPEHRTVFADWVFYSTESERVRDHASRLFPDMATEEDY